jgi:fucose 4-O-acetylase-like acetyltransferase
MPLFFLLSGLNVERSLRKGPVAFLRSKLWTVAYPYILWSLIQGSIELALASHMNAPISGRDLASILWRPIAQFWFLYALFLYHLVAALLATRPHFLLAISAILFAVSLKMQSGDAFLHNVAYMMLFYVIGVVHSTSVLSSASRLRLRYLAILVGLFVAASYYGWNASSHRYDSIYSVPATIFGIATIIAFSAAIANTAFVNILSTVGIASTAIYVLHILMSSLGRELLKFAGVENVTVYLAVETAVGVLIPLMTYQFVAKGGPKMIAVFGFGGRPLRRNREEGVKQHHRSSVTRQHLNSEIIR